MPREMESLAALTAAVCCIRILQDKPWLWDSISAGFGERRSLHRDLYLSTRPKGTSRVTQTGPRRDVRRQRCYYSNYACIWATM